MAFGAKVKLSVNKAGAKSFRNEIQRFVDDSTASNPIKIKNIKLELNKSQQSQLRKNIQNYLNTSGDNLTIKINRIDASGAVKQLRSQLETMLSGLSITGLKDFLGTDGVGSTYERAANAADKLAAAQENVRRKSEQVNASAQILRTLQNNANSTYTHGNKLTGSEQVGKISSEYQSLCVMIEKTKNLEGEEQQTAINSITEKIAALRKYIDEQYESQAASAKAAKEEAKNNEITIASLTRLNSLYKKLSTYASNNPRVMKDGYMGGNITNWMAMLTSGNDLSTDELAKIENGFAAITLRAKEAGLEGKTFGDRILAAYQKFGGWTIITRTLTFAIQKLKEMISVVIELDTAMTELRKVTDLTEQAYDEVFERAISRAKTLGATVSDTITATADFARLGYGIKEAEELSNAAIIYKNVGDGIESISDASESIISTMKAFGIQAEESMSIVDKFNEVGNNFAISSKGVGEALQRSASALAVAGNTIDESIALAVGMNAVVQDPEKVGTVLKTASMYLRAAETDLEAAGEATDGMAKSVSELRAELLLLTNNKVDIMADDNTFKSTIQIYRELAAVWNELADVDAANILELIGGKRNATANASLLQNFDDVEKALASSAGAAGSAIKENEKYLDSIQGKLSKFKATFEEFSANFISSEMVSAVVSLGTALLNVLTVLDKIHLLIPLLTVSLTLLVARKKALQLAESTSMVNTLASSIIKEKAVTDTLATSVAMLSVKEKALLATKLEQSITSGAITAAQGAQIASALGLAGAEGTLTVANKALGVSFKSLMASIPVFGWIALGISVALEAIVPLVDWIKNSSKSIEDLNSEWDELSNKINTTANDFKELSSSANDIIPRFTELAKGVDQFGKNVSLTDDEYSEFLDLNNKIAEMFPELNLGMDSNGNAMLALSYSADTLTNSLNNLVEAQRDAANKEIADTMPEVVKNITGTTEKYQKDIDKKKKILSDWNEFARTSRDSVYKSGEKIEDRFIDEDVIAMAETLGVAREEIQDLIEYVDDSDVSGHFNWDKVLDSDAVKNAVAGIEKEIDSLGDNINAKWKQLNPVVTAWMQTDYQYQDLSNDMQSLVTKMLASVDYQELGLKTEDDIKKYLSNNIIAPIHDAEPEVQNALTAAFSLKDLFADGTINAGEYKTTIDKIFSDLKDAGFNDDTIKAIKVSLDIDDFDKKLNHIKDLLSDDFKDEVNSLSASDIELAYQIKADKGSMTFDELRSEIDDLRMQNAPMVDVLDFSSMADGLDKAKDGMDNLINAMSKLKSGTALTKSELAQLALEYPKLLEASNIFTDGSIEGQKNMLNTILDMQEQEYDAEIDKKIAELEATEQVLQDQLDLESQKAALIQEIKNIEANGVLGQEAELVQKISELNDLQGKNYVSMEDGMLTVNQEALNKHLNQDEDFGNKSASNIWSPFAKTIKTAHTKGFSAALQAANNYGSKLASWAKNIGSNVLSGLANAVKDALSGEWKGLKSYFSGVSTSISAPDVTVTFDGGSAFVGNQSLNDWVSEQETASKERIAQTQELLQKTLNAKNNLAALKGLDLADIYGNSNNKDNKDKKDKDKKEVDEYIAEVERYNEALQKLKDIEQEQAELERELENTDSALEKVDIQKKLNQIYADKQNALHELNNLRDNTIHDTIPQLEALGFQIEYNDETNRLYIANLEHLNELQADSAGKYETVQEATNALRKETEELIDDITDLNDENADSSEEWLKLADNIKEGKDKIVEYLNEAVTEAVDFVSAMQDVYNTLQEAADEYAESGSISVDTLKTIAEYGAEYLTYLKDENGQLVINKDRINAVVAARTKQLAVDTALSYVEKIRDALNENKIKELNRLITATEQASDATWGLVYSNLALLNLDDSQYKSALDNINKLRALADSAVKSIYSQADEDSSSAMDKKKDALDTILDLTMNLIQYEKDQEVEALEDQIDKYKKIIELKKESLTSSKEENDYNKEVASKVKEIAELQSRINQLSLDDSREAQVERKSLEEELADLQTDLADYQADYSLDKQTEALDDELSAYEETKNEEIKIVEKSISSTEKLYQLAIDRITNDWDNLYDDIIAWNYDAGSTIESEIVSAWELASKAVQEYGSYLEAVNKIAAGKSAGNTIVSESGNYGDPKAIISQMRTNSKNWLISDGDTQKDLERQNADYARQLSNMYGEDIYYDNGSWYRANGDVLYSVDKWEAVDYITKAMYNNSQKWSAASDSERNKLEDANIKMAGYIEELSGQRVWKDENGVWYIGNDELYKSYGFIYHNGGVVGTPAGTKDSEVLALLEKGELVLDQQKKDSLYKYMDVSTYMMKKFGTTVDNLGAISSVSPRLFANVSENLKDKAGTLAGISGKNTNYIIESLQVTTPIQVLQKLDEEDIREHARTIGDISAKYIQEGFTRKGITPNTTLF